MEVTVNRNQTIAGLEKELKEYKGEFLKTIEIYKKKLAEYSKYVERKVQEGTTESIKSAPYPPSSKVEDFEESIEVLKAHVAETIKMDDDEFRSLKSGIKNLHVSNIHATQTLNALSY